MIRRRTLSRNCLDVRDHVQVKVVKKRLKLTDAPTHRYHSQGREFDLCHQQGGRRAAVPGRSRGKTPPAAVIAATEPEAALSRQAEAL